MQRPAEVLWRQTVESGLGWISWEGTLRGVSRLTFGHASAARAEDALVAHETERTRDRGNEGQSDREIGRIWKFSPSLLPSVSPFYVPGWYSDAEQLLLAYCDGQPVDLAAIPLDVSLPTPFAEKVIRALVTVGYGETISYAGLAELAGSPKAARAVGTVMSRNTVPLIIPCHRVIGAGGRLGGYSAPRGLAMKEELLQMEAANALKIQASAHPVGV